MVAAGDGGRSRNGRAGGSGVHGARDFNLCHGTGDYCRNRPDTGAGVITAAKPGLGADVTQTRRQGRKDRRAANIIGPVVPHDQRKDDFLSFVHRRIVPGSRQVKIGTRRRCDDNVDRGRVVGAIGVSLVHIQHRRGRGQGLARSTGVDGGDHAQRRRIVLGQGADRPDAGCADVGADAGSIADVGQSRRERKQDFHQAGVVRTVVVEQGDVEGDRLANGRRQLVCDQTDLQVSGLVHVVERHIIKRLARVVGGRVRADLEMVRLQVDEALVEVGCRDKVAGLRVALRLGALQGRLRVRGFGDHEFRPEAERTDVLRSRRRTVIDAMHDLRRISIQRDVGVFPGAIDRGIRAHAK